MNMTYKDLASSKFYSYLWDKTFSCFNQSRIKKYQDSINAKWYYALTPIQIKPGKGIIAGLNWGAKKINGTYEEYEIPSRNIDLALDPNFYSYRFITRIRSYLSENIGINDLENEINYTNLCFFRSHTTDQIENSDWIDSKKLFTMFVDYVHPPWILFLGTTAKKYVRNNEFSDKQFFVPHPCARLFNNERNAYWIKIKNILN